jgi:hypothetical protein
MGCHGIAGLRLHLRLTGQLSITYSHRASEMTTQALGCLAALTRDGIVGIRRTYGEPMKRRVDPIQIDQLLSC